MALGDIEAALGGRYRVQRELGRGGFGAVYEVDAGAGGRQALKLLERPPHDLDGFQARFLREVRNARRLDHPNAVRIFDHGALPDGRLYYAMELCEGPSLRELAAGAGGLLPIARLVRLVVHVLRALGAAHALDMVHRDVKPDNVHVVPGAGGIEMAKVLDFGLAKIGGGRASQELTREGQIAGTIEYMSPEHLLGRPLDGRADLYAVGVLLFELLCGRRPFPSGDDRRLIEAQVRKPPPSLVAMSQGRVDPALEAVVFQALEKDPARRFVNAEAMAQALHRAAPEAMDYRPPPLEPAGVGSIGDEPVTGPGASMPVRTGAIPPTRAAGAIPPTRDAGAVPPTRSAGAVPPTRDAGIVPPTQPLDAVAVTRPAPAPPGAIPPTQPLDAVAVTRPAPPPRSDPAGGLGSEELPLGGRYILRRLVSEASRHGRTYEAYDTHEGRSVCVKVLQGRGAIDDADLKRYLRGVEALRRIASPHVVRLLDGGVTPDGRPYYALEWVPGEPLERFLPRGRVPLPEAAGAICQVLEGLQAAHDAYVVHRDVTPGHILVVPTDRGAVVKLSGFGIAKAVLSDDGTGTRWGADIGTPRYMSPEQLKGLALDGRSDIFSAGVVLFEMLAGRPPFDGSSAVELARSVLLGPPPALPDEVPAEIRAAVGPVLSMALARDRDARYPSAAATRAALAPLAGELARGDFDAAELAR